MSIFKRKRQPEPKQPDLVQSDDNHDGNHPKVPPINYTERTAAANTVTSEKKQAPAPQPTKASIDWTRTETQLHALDAQRDQLAESLRDELLSARSVAKYDLRQLTRPNRHEQAPIVDQQQVQTLEHSIEVLNEKLTHWYGTDKMANEIHFDAARPYLLLNNGLIHQPTAVQRRSLQRLKQLFSDHKIVPTNVTIDYDDLLVPTWLAYQQDDLVLPKTKLLNLFHDLQNRDQTAGQKANELTFAPGFKVVAEDKDKKVYDTQGALNMVIDYRENGNLFTVRHYLNKALLSRDLFDAAGVIAATQYYAADDEQQVIRENFYRNDGTLAISKSYLKGEPYIQIFGPTNVLMAIFDSDLDLIEWWFENHVLQPNSVIIVSIDSVLYDTLIAAQDQGLEVIPLVSELDPQSPRLQDLVQHKHGIESILVAEPSIKQYLEQRTKIDLDVSVISPLKAESANADESATSAAD
ncbi:hypothetical protein [Lapidilactobacillus luobeiensis]|uniref:hypothetical protein n=1 Tax=Lapidilactobacillus luobeiensis TaxID=2950371 RepID=UPI0021C47E85|nr:hypothetical protein [Lapidilactobacillus luobeiensis]